jgi:low affinity Fe/Cu permease
VRDNGNIIDRMKNTFSAFASGVNRFVSSPAATGAAFLVIVVWALFGPITHYSDGWQLFINTGTTIVTFLMVFVLNNAQSRDTTAMNAKLDALIKAIEKADDRLIGLETLPASEADAITHELHGPEEAAGKTPAGRGSG